MSTERLLFLNKLKVCRYSPITINHYEKAFVRLAMYCNKSPLHLKTEDIERYVLHLLDVEKLVPTTTIQHIAAIKKFYSLLAPDSNIVKTIGKIKNY